MTETHRLTDFVKKAALGATLMLVPAAVTGVVVYMLCTRVGTDPAQDRLYEALRQKALEDYGEIVLGGETADGRAVHPKEPREIRRTLPP